MYTEAIGNPVKSARAARASTDPNHPSLATHPLKADLFSRRFGSSRPQNVSDAGILSQTDRETMVQICQDMIAKIQAGATQEEIMAVYQTLTDVMEKKAPVLPQRRIPYVDVLPADYQERIAQSWQEMITKIQAGATQEDIRKVYLTLSNFLEKKIPALEAVTGKNGQEIGSLIKDPIQQEALGEAAKAGRVDLLELFSCRYGLPAEEKLQHYEQVIDLALEGEHIDFARKALFGDTKIPKEYPPGDYWLEHRRMRPRNTDTPIPPEDRLGVLLRILDRTPEENVIKRAFTQSLIKEIGIYEPEDVLVGAAKANSLLYTQEILSRGCRINSNEYQNALCIAIMNNNRDWPDSGAAAENVQIRRSLITALDSDSVIVDSQLLWGVIVSIVQCHDAETMKMLLEKMPELMADPAKANYYRLFPRMLGLAATLLGPQKKEYPDSGFAHPPLPHRPLLPLVQTLVAHGANPAEKDNDGNRNALEHLQATRQRVTSQSEMNFSPAAAEQLDAVEVYLRSVIESKQPGG